MEKKKKKSLVLFPPEPEANTSEHSVIGSVGGGPMLVF